MKQWYAKELSNLTQVTLCCLMITLVRKQKPG